MSTSDGGLRQIIREELAELAHSQWAGWMKYLFAKCRELPDGSLAIPPSLVARWARQTASDYADLPAQERQSDIVEADKAMAVFEKALVSGVLKSKSPGGDVLFINDEPPHNTDSPLCWCAPTVEKRDGGVEVVIHKSIAGGHVFRIR